MKTEKFFPRMVLPMMMFIKKYSQKIVFVFFTESKLIPHSTLKFMVTHSLDSIVDWLDF